MRSLLHKPPDHAAMIMLAVVHFTGDVYSAPAFASQSRKIEDLSLVLLPITPGTFQMGSSEGESDEKPVTRVTLTHGFWLGKTEVTQAQWQAIMGNNPSNFVGVDRPVEKVLWSEAMEFGRKLTGRERAAGRLPEGYEYTLPTEAQWEYACRAGKTGPHAGKVEDMAWYDANSGRQTQPVARKQPNAWGLYDMHGNVWEWCLDWKGSYPGGSVADPRGPSAGTYRVLRGAAWFYGAGDCRSSLRYGNASDRRFNHVGFRIALVPSR